MINLNNFFNPSSIAIIGASKKGKVGNVLVENLLKFKNYSNSSETQFSHL